MYFHCSNDFQNNIRRNFTSICLPFLCSYHNYNLISHNPWTTVQARVARWKTLSRRISRKALRTIYLTWPVFLVRDYIHKFCCNNDQSTTAKTYPRHVIFYSIAVKLRLVMPKINKKQKGNQKNLLANFIFLKVVASNVRDAFGANHFTPFYIN